RRVRRSQVGELNRAVVLVTAPTVGQLSRLGGAHDRIRCAKVPEDRQTEAIRYQTWGADPQRGSLCDYLLGKEQHDSRLRGEKSFIGLVDEQAGITMSWLTPIGPCSSIL